MKLPFKKDRSTSQASAEKRGELFAFVSHQFKELAKKNIRIPVKLYHL